MKTRQLIKEMKNIILFLAIIIVILALLLVKLQLGVNERCSEMMKSLDFVKCGCKNNLSNLLTLSTMGKYCKEKEPKGYKLKFWWDGCASRDEKAGFTCGYVNKDGANIYKCYKWEDVLS